MGDDNLLVPISDEQAKAVQEAFKLGAQGLETARAAGGYLARILGTLPEDLVGILGGDWVRARRVENMIGFAEQAQERLRSRGVQEPEPATLSIALPLLEAAADESREEIVDLWARLLAAAMDPGRSRRVRQTFIATVKSIDPVDALVLRSLRTAPDQGIGGSTPQRRQLAQLLDVRENEAAISLERLHALGCALPNGLHVYRLTPFGVELLEVLED